MSKNDKPLVSIGIPTYNRAESLKRAINSAVNQTYTNLEIIISDNCSTDETQQVCEDFCKLDSRVTYIRQAENFGATNNFNFVLKKATGEYFMWLADDDWIDNEYIEKCANFMLMNSDYSLVSGLAQYYKNKVFSHADIILNLETYDPCKRVIKYYKNVRENGIFYGLMKSSQIKKIPMYSVMGGDWHMVALLCFLGKIKTIDSTSIHRESTWSEDYFQRLAKSLGLTRFSAEHPRLSIAISSFQYMAVQKNEFYQQANFWTRYSLAMRVFIVNIKRYYLNLGLVKRMLKKIVSYN